MHITGAITASPSGSFPKTATRNSGASGDLQSANVSFSFGGDDQGGVTVNVGGYLSNPEAGGATRVFCSLFGSYGLRAGGRASPSGDQLIVPLVLRDDLGEHLLALLSVAKR